MSYSVEISKTFQVKQGLASPVLRAKGGSAFGPTDGFEVVLRAGVAFNEDQLTDRGWFFDTDAGEEAITGICKQLASDTWTRLFDFRPTFELVARWVFEELRTEIRQLAYIELENSTLGVKTRYQGSAKVRIKRIDKALPLPEFDESDPRTGRLYARSRVAAFGLLCRVDKIIQPGELELVPVNNVIETPPNCLLMLVARSSTPWKKGLMLANGVGIIDPFYSGEHDEVKVQLYNFSDSPVEVKRGEALAQGIIVRREQIDWEEVDSMGVAGHGGYKT